MKKEESIVDSVLEEGTSYFEAVHKNAKENMQKAVDGMKKLVKMVSGENEKPALEEQLDEIEEMKAKKAAAIKQVLKADLEEAKNRVAQKKELQENRSKIGDMADEAAK